MSAVNQALKHTHVLHFPVAFPEVFLRDRPGFDVILGNPPWKEATVEEHAFWARHFPGLRGLSQREQEAEKARFRKERPDLVNAFETETQEMNRLRKALVGGVYPGIGTGDPDLYKAFCWRFWHLTAADGGRIGVVLPRSALAAKGSMEFRQAIFGESEQVDIVVLKNKRGWVFDSVTPQYTVGLACIARGTPKEKSISLRGPYASESAFTEGIRLPAARFNREDVLKWNDTASLPLLPDPDSIAVFAQIRKSPRLDLNERGGVRWRARPDREIDATNQKAFMTFDRPHSDGTRDPTANSTRRRRNI